MYIYIKKKYRVNTPIAASLTCDMCHHPSEDLCSACNASCRQSIFPVSEQNKHRVFVGSCFSQSQKFLEWLSFSLFFYFCTLLLFDLISLFLFILSLSLSLLFSLNINVTCYYTDCFIRIDLVSLSRGLDEDAVYVCVCVCSREFSDTFTFQLCLDSNRYFTKPLYLHIDMYTQLASNA